MDSESIISRIAPPSFRLPVEAGKRGVIVVDTDGRVAFTDSSVFHLLGIEPESILGRDRDEVVRETLKHRFKSPQEYESSCIWLREHPEDVLDDVLELAGEDGRFIHRYSAPMFDEAGTPKGRVEIYSDITRRRELESAARKAFEELEETQDQLVQSEKLRAVGEIASGVAHDFNNSLGIILGNIQLLLRSTEDPAARRKLESAQQAAQDGVNTVRRIQEFTRSMPQEPPVVLDLSRLAAEVVEMMRATWGPGAGVRGAEVAVDLDMGERVFVKGSPHELREVVTNVLLNAVQAMPEGGSIGVITGREGGFCRVRVVDTGIGMDDDTRSRVFDPFFTTRGVEGTGLGMSVAYGIIKRHGGRIDVSSVPGEGTTVEIVLPAVDFGPSEVEEDALEVAGTRAARVLVVDDEEKFLEVFVEMLRSCGHEASVARSGREALEQFQAGRFDVVFTDLGMPEMSGWQVAEAIKKIEPFIPVVLLTGWGAAIDESELKGSKVDMALAKPVRLENLSAIVEEALGRKG